MKRIIEFQISEDNYAFVENEDVIFEIDRQTHQFDVKSFFFAFFANNKDYSDIQINFASDIETDDKRIVDAVLTLVNSICDRLMCMPAPEPH